jgi:hypothetical protein
MNQYRREKSTWLFFLACVLCLQVGMARDLRAQQACLTATPKAISAVNHLLASGDSTWLRAHGITAADVNGLTALTDSTDATTCQQLSTYFTRPVYFWRAGNYTIASDAVSVIDSTYTVHYKSRPTVFVYDSNGDLVFPSGSP